jgi:hypothetical protein
MLRCEASRYFKNKKREYLKDKINELAMNSMNRIIRDLYRGINEFKRGYQINQVGLKLNGTHQLLAYADDVNLLGDNTDTIKKNTETLIDASKEVGPEINIERTKCKLLSRN